MSTMKTSVSTLVCPSNNGTITLAVAMALVLPPNWNLLLAQDMPTLIPASVSLCLSIGSRCQPIRLYDEPVSIMICWWSPRPSINTCSGP